MTSKLGQMNDTILEKRSEFEQTAEKFNITKQASSLIPGAPANMMGSIQDKFKDNIPDVSGLLGGLTGSLTGQNQEENKEQKGQEEGNQN